MPIKILDHFIRQRSEWDAGVWNPVCTFINSCVQLPDDGYCICPLISEKQPNVPVDESTVTILCRGRIFNPPPYNGEHSIGITIKDITFKLNYYDSFNEKTFGLDITGEAFTVLSPTGTDFFILKIVVSATQAVYSYKREADVEFTLLKTLTHSWTGSLGVNMFLNNFENGEDLDAGEEIDFFAVSDQKHPVVPEGFEENFFDDFDTLDPAKWSAVDDQESSGVIAKLTYHKEYIPDTFTNQPIVITQDMGLTALTAWWAALSQGNNGTDIGVYSDAACTTALKRCCVYVDVANKLIEMPVKIPSMSSAADVVIYLKAGDTPAANDADVFPSTDQYYPLQTTTPVDYGPNAVTGTSVNSTNGAGKVGNGLSVNSGGSIVGLERALGDSNNSWAIKFWIKHAQHRETNRLIFSKGYYNSAGDKVLFTPYFDTNGKMHIWCTYPGSYETDIAFTSVYDDDVLRSFTLVLNPSSDGYAWLYEGGIFVEKIAMPYFGVYNGYATLLGNWFSGGNDLLGLLDSVQIMSRPPSANEIALIYDNENAPGTVASAETYNPSRIDTTIPSAVQYKGQAGEVPPMGNAVLSYLGTLPDFPTGDKEVMFKIGGLFDREIETGTPIGGNEVASVDVTMISEFLTFIYDVAYSCSGDTLEWLSDPPSGVEVYLRVTATKIYRYYYRDGAYGGPEEITHAETAWPDVLKLGLQGINRDYAISVLDYVQILTKDTPDTPLTGNQPRNILDGIRFSVEIKRPGKPSYVYKSIWDSHFSNTQSGVFAFDRLLSVNGADITLEDSLNQAVAISLFTNAGWWGDALSADPTDKIGSDLYLLDREKITKETISRFVSYVKKSLQWMMDSKLASSIEVKAEKCRIIYDSTGNSTVLE